MSDLVPHDNGGGLQPTGQQPPPFAPASPVTRPQVEDTIDLRELIDVLRRNKRLILAITLVFTLFAFVIVQRQLPQYRAEGVFRLKDERQALTGQLVTPGVEQVLGRTADPLLSEIEVLRSRTVIGEVVERFGLRLQPETRGVTLAIFQDVEVAPDAAVDTIQVSFEDDGVVARSRAGEQRAAYGQPLYISGARFTVPERPEHGEATFVIVPAVTAAERLLENLVTRPVDRTDVVRVQYTSSSPQFSQAIVNATLEAFQVASARNAAQQSQRRRAFIEEQLASTDSTLAAAQAELAAFRSREEVLSSREQLAAQQTSRTELEMRRQTLDAERRVYRDLLNALSRDSAGIGTFVSSPGIAQNPVISGLYAQLLQYQTRRDSLTAGQFGRSEQSAPVRQVTAQIASTQLQLRDAVTSHLGALDGQISALDDLLARSSAEIRSLPAKEAEEMRLVLRLETAQRVADQLREEYQRARIAEAIEVGQVEVVDWAALPLQPIGSGKALKLMLGLMLGLMVGSGAAFLREHLNRTVASRSELEPLLLAPVLGTVPSIQANGTKPGRRRLTPLRLPALGGGGQRAHPVETAGSSLVTLTNAHSPGAEAYRSLRTNLLFSRAARRLQTLAITSSAPAEGKSTTCANLAIAFAQQGMRVLLIDADMRRASLHTLFNLSREPGLSDVLGSDAEVRDVIRPGGTPGLDLLTAGLVPFNPAELLGGGRMKAMLEDLRRDYELIIIDTPPVLAAGDAAILAAISDATVLVVRAGQTDRAAARAAADQVRAVGGRLIGSILNDPEGSTLRYGEYYYNAYYGAEEHT